MRCSPWCRAATKGSSVRLDEPAWWYGSDGGLAARCLQPLAAAWGAIATRRYQHEAPYRSRLPVICIGNFTAGGTGKTPLAMCVAAELARLGRRPAFLTRGFGGRASRTALGGCSRGQRHGRGRRAPAAGTRLAGARRQGSPSAVRASSRPVKARADVIVMDDGLQNPQLAKDLVLAVVDGRRGIGNGRVIPAGPLRAPLDFQLGLTDAVVVNMSLGAAAESASSRLAASEFPRPRSVRLGRVARARHRGSMARRSLPSPASARRSGSSTCWAGSAPRSCAQWPLPITTSTAPPRPSICSVSREKHTALLVTTEKDWVRLDGSGGVMAALKTASRPLPVAMVFDERDRGRLTALLDMALKAGNAPPS